MGKRMNNRDFQVFGDLAKPPLQRRKPIRAWWMDCLASRCAVNRTAIAPRKANKDGEIRGARQVVARSTAFKRRPAFARLWSGK
jgi:hypothetical protein